MLHFLSSYWWEEEEISWPHSCCPVIAKLQVLNGILMHGLNPQSLLYTTGRRQAGTNHSVLIAVNMYVTLKLFSEIMKWIVPVLSVLQESVQLWSHLTTISRIVEKPNQKTQKTQKTATFRGKTSAGKLFVQFCFFVQCFCGSRFHSCS